MALTFQIIQQTLSKSLFINNFLIKEILKGVKNNNLKILQNKTFVATEISISPVDGKTVYVWGDENYSFKSDDCGSSWKKITHP